MFSGDWSSARRSRCHRADPSMIALERLDGGQTRAKSCLGRRRPGVGHEKRAVDRITIACLADQQEYTGRRMRHNIAFFQAGPVDSRGSHYHSFTSFRLRRPQR
jgi:hypothetical protein